MPVEASAAAALDKRIALQLIKEALVKHRLRKRSCGRVALEPIKVDCDITARRVSDVQQFVNAIWKTGQLALKKTRMGSLISEVKNPS